MLNMVASLHVTCTCISQDGMRSTRYHSGWIDRIPVRRISCLS
ncbi:hypothetical protein I553_7450 [Mycobacterium xenopi 4042]|uniref:Uncharacterized protein n=1 Tax=Mycobacterium xenopi 4042 TaxID=1299334 RepID=X8E8A0_MYCXE|nr:hypothetical protein I553_7450 [Mycobacterium xenopi 4042]